MMNYHKYQSAQPAKIYLAGPGGRMTAPLQGVEKARLTQKFNDIWEMDLEVCRTLTSPEGNRENPAYPLLLPMQELYVEDLGWFRIQKTPSITMDGTREIQSFYRLWNREPVARPGCHVFISTAVILCPGTF